MSPQLDANAFMQSYLRNPADATTRLVFADWLEETGEQSNIAWAHYIRLKSDAGRHEFESAEWKELDRQAKEYVSLIRASLTIPATLFVGYPRSLLQLLPVQNFTLKLAGITFRRAVVELMPESIARENLVFPLDIQDRTLIIATTDPSSVDLMQTIEFILNKDVLLVRAEAQEIVETINQHYGHTETETVDSYIHFPEPTVSPIQGDNRAISRLVYFTIAEAINLDADSIQILPTEQFIQVRYRIRDEWVDRDSMPARIAPAITACIVMRAQMDLRVTFDNAFATNEGAIGIIPGVSFGGHTYDIQVTIIPGNVAPEINLDIVNQV